VDLGDGPDRSRTDEAACADDVPDGAEVSGCTGMIERDLDDADPVLEQILDERHQAIAGLNAAKDGDQARIANGARNGGRADLGSGGGARVG
jgi:hypothetical protein